MTHAYSTAINICQLPLFSTEICLIISPFTAVYQKVAGASCNNNTETFIRELHQRAGGSSQARRAAE